jgi:catecholate siderophore receptor
LELEVAGRITPQWDVFGGVALMRAEIDEQAPGHSAAIAGMRPRNAPPYTFNVWSTYKLGGGWKLGGGVRGMGNRMVYGLNSSTTPSGVNVAPYYQRWDAMLAYEQRTYTIKFNVLNVLDRRYYESVYENGGFAVPGTQRTAQVTAVFKF